MWGSLWQIGLQKLSYVSTIMGLQIQSFAFSWRRAGAGIRRGLALQRAVPG